MSGAPLIGWRLAQFAPLGNAVPTDPFAKEARSSGAFGDAVEIRVQEVSNGRTRIRTAGGEDIQIRKTFLLRQADAQEKGWTPDLGHQYQGCKNRIGVVCDTSRLYIAALRPRGHGALADAYWEIDLADKAPERRAD